MGEIVAAALVSHHPGIMLPEKIRIAAGAGRDTTLVAGFSDIRARLDAAGADTLVIFDTHWITTLRHLVSGADRYAGTYTSDEMPVELHGIPYDYPGAPELAQAVQAVAAERQVPAVAVKDPGIAQHYPTLNLLHYLHRGERVMSVGMCQNALVHHYLAFGEVLHAAVERSDCRVALLASGALSHEMITLDFKPADPRAWSPANVSRDENRELDLHVIGLLESGDHAGVLDLYPKLRAAQFEGFGGHYVMMVGALGGRDFRSAGTPLSEYESAAGTGNIHMWFDV